MNTRIAAIGLGVGAAAAAGTGTALWLDSSNRKLAGRVPESPEKPGDAWDHGEFPIAEFEAAAKAGRSTGVGRSLAALGVGAAAIGGALLLKAPKPALLGAAGVAGAAVGIAAGLQGARFLHDRKSDISPEDVADQLVGAYDRNEDGDLDVYNPHERIHTEWPRQREYDYTTIFFSDRSVWSRPDKLVPVFDPNRDGTFTKKEIAEGVRSFDRNDNGQMDAGELHKLTKQTELDYWNKPTTTRTFGRDYPPAPYGPGAGE